MLFTVTSLNYVARPPGPDPNLDQNYDIFVGTILAVNANVLHAPNRVRSEIRKDPSVTLFFGRTSLSNVWIRFKCQTPNFSNSSISITGSPEINFNPYPAEYLEVFLKDIYLKQYYSTTN